MNVLEAQALAPRGAAAGAVNMARSGVANEPRAGFVLRSTALDRFETL